MVIASIVGTDVSGGTIASVSSPASCAKTSGAVASVTDASRVIASGTRASGALASVPHEGVEVAYTHVPIGVPGVIAQPDAISPPGSVGHM
jgi:hypothetical protein